MRWRILKKKFTRGWRGFLLSACLAVLFLCGPGAALAAPIQWETLAPGLELAKISLAVELPQQDENSGSHVETFPVTAIVARIAPEQFAFSLFMASEKGHKTLAEACKAEDFSVAVNAGMYLPDRLTNTGHLRGAAHVNNPRVAAKFGSFFVAEPLQPRLPKAQLLDRHRDNWEQLLPAYGIVMQNYRMTTPDGQVIWKKNDRPHSVAALSQDSSGNVLFILCPSPVPAASFLEALLREPLKAKRVMYLEGGTEAVLYIRVGDTETIYAGRHASGLWSGGGGLVLPNILGARKRTK